MVVGAGVAAVVAWTVVAVAGVAEITLDDEPPYEAGEADMAP
jgi:predicted oxidoreductase